MDTYFLYKYNADAFLYASDNVITLLRQASSRSHTSVFCDVEFDDLAIFQPGRI